MIPEWVKAALAIPGLFLADDSKNPVNINEQSPLSQTEEE